MKRLFDKNHRYKPEAAEISDEIDQKIREFFIKYQKKYSPRELALILHTSIQEHMCESVLDIL